MRRTGAPDMCNAGWGKPHRGEGRPGLRTEMKRNSPDGLPAGGSAQDDAKRALADQRRLRLKVDEQNRAIRERQQQLLATVEQLQEREAEAVRLARIAQEESRKARAALAELKAAQERLVRSEKLAAIGQLSAGISHELRNPLGAIRNAWFSVERRIHRDMTPEPRLNRMAEIISAELDRCTAFIGQLLDFARERPPHRVPYPLPKLVSDTFAVVAKPAPTIELVADIPEGLPVPFVDSDQFRQILVNLVQNAVEAVDRERGRVVVTAEEEDGWFTLKVSDNGSGIPPETQPRIFEPLFTTKQRGTGLGLPIVASIVQRHGARIELHSETGQGTTFTIVFPQGQPSSESPIQEGGAAELRR